MLNAVLIKQVTGVVSRKYQVLKIARKKSNFWMVCEVVYPRTDISASPQAVASSEVVKTMYQRLACRYFEETGTAGDPDMTIWKQKLTTGPGIQGYAEPPDSPYTNTIVKATVIQRYKWTCKWTCF